MPSNSFSVKVLPDPVGASTRPNRRQGPLRHLAAGGNGLPPGYPNAIRSPNGTSARPFTNQSTGYDGGAAGNSPCPSVK